MTVTTSTNKTQPLGNGVTTSFPYAFRIYAAADLVVVSTVIATGVDTTLVLGTDYTVTGAGSYNGGNVVFGVAPATGVRITIRRVMSITQQTDLRNNGAYFAETHEDVFDLLTMIAQQLGEQFSRALLQPISDTAPIGQLPTAAARASKILGFDSAGNIVAVIPADQSASALALLLASVTGAAQVGVAGSGTVQTSLDSKLPKAGGTMAGLLTMAAAINEARATVAGHATAADIWGAAGNKINLTGVITYTNFPAAPQAGANRWLYPAAGAAFTNSATFDILGGVDFTVAAGDIVYLEAITTTTFKLIPFRKNGRAVVAGIDFDGAPTSSANTAWTRANSAGKIIVCFGGPTTQTPPLASALRPGESIAFFNIGNTVTVARAGAETFYGGGGAVASFILNSNEGVILVSDGSNWLCNFFNGATGLAPQTWQDMGASRLSGTTYTNSTGRTIAVSVWTGAAATTSASMVVSGVTVSSSAFSVAGALGTSSVYAVVPNGATYSATTTGGFNIRELR